MSPSPTREPQHQAGAPCPPPPPPATTPRRSRATRRIPVRCSVAERIYWAAAEERAFGRLAQETDHVFDTSYPWAA